MRIRRYRNRRIGDFLKEQIKTLILDELTSESISANELYKRLGYSGNASK